MCKGLKNCLPNTRFRANIFAVWKNVGKDMQTMAKSNTYDAGSIAVLEGLESVRKSQGIYIGSVSTKGINHLIYKYD